MVSPLDRINPSAVILELYQLCYLLIEMVNVAAFLRHKTRKESYLKSFEGPNHSHNQTEESSYSFGSCDLTSDATNRL